MRNKIYIQIVVGISLLILTSPTGAQDEQWLQYHSEREAQRIVGDMGASTTPTHTDESSARCGQPGASSAPREAKRDLFHKPFAGRVSW